MHAAVHGRRDGQLAQLDDRRVERVQRGRVLVDAPHGRLERGARVLAQRRLMRDAIRWPSACNQVAIRWQSGSPTPPDEGCDERHSEALRRHSEGTQKALRRHLEGTEEALRGTQRALRGHSEGTQRALRGTQRHSEALNRHSEGPQKALKRHSRGQPPRPPPSGYAHQTWAPP
jgi:hypothetical protein